MTARELAERESKPVALAWVARAIEVLCTPRHPLRSAALNVNFALRRAPVLLRPFLFGYIGASFMWIEATLHESARRFHDLSPALAKRFFGDAPPAPACVWEGNVYFAPSFASFGPMCRAAMVVHESVHVFDSVSGEADVHVSEFAEPAFSAIPPERQIHNPSAYASFSAQVHEGRIAWPASARFGAGNPEL